MELLPTPDFFDSIDFNFLTAEIFHTQEHEFDYTLKDGEQMQLDWREEDENEMIDDVFDAEDEKLDEQHPIGETEENQEDESKPVDD